VTFPGALDEAVERWLAGQGRLAVASAALSAAYRKGETSSAVSLAAYMATRAPATFAANVKVHEALPVFAPASLLDVGTGPGTATWAALAAWPSLRDIMQCEQDASFAALASHLNAESGMDALEQARIIQLSEKALPPDARADAVIASYVLAELPVEEMTETSLRLWSRARQLLLLIEPGTPQGFTRLRVARDTLIRAGAFIVAPCTHQHACPMAGADWCHFKVRLQRSRAHMHAKQAVVPFEDEAFSYLALSRTPAPQSGARIIAPPIINKAAANLRLCIDGAVNNVSVASRDKASYKRAKKKAWGGLWE
jgi:ribosomal protein RSM22 (predicted rRNA methylase)